jgi:hypothetical protein
MRNIWLLSAVLLLAACGGKEKKIDTQSYKDDKKKLAEKEEGTPTDFLSIITSHQKKTLFGLGRQTITKGEVSNNASICSYKDVRIKMLCYDKLGNRIEEHEDVMDDIIAPGQTASFRVQYKLPKETDSIALSVMSATPLVPEEKK